MVVLPYSLALWVLFRFLFRCVWMLDDCEISMLPQTVSVLALKIDF